MTTRMLSIAISHNHLKPKSNYLFYLLLPVFLANITSGQVIDKNQVKAAANKQFVELINSEAIPINAQATDDFDDLEFLKKILKDKRIVYLGESNHHTESYNIIKYRLVRYLNQEMGFNVIAFESSIHSCSYSNIVKDSMNSFYLLTHSLMGAWRTPVVADLLHYVKTSKMSLTGFDPNSNALMLDKKYYEKLIENDTKLGIALYKLDSAYESFQNQRNSYFRKEKVDEIEENHLDETRDLLRKEYVLVKRSFVQKWNQEQDKVSLIINKIIENKLKLLNCSNHLKSDYEDKYITNSTREEWMTSNIRFLVDSVYKDEKIIIWAHNNHISKGGESTITENRNLFLNNSMGYQLNKFYASDSYHIALYGFPGVIGKGFATDFYCLKEAKKNSLEAIMYNSQYDSYFLQLSREKLPFLNKPILNFTEGNSTNSSVLTDCYDAMFFMKQLAPSILIRFDEKEYYEQKYRELD